MQVAQLNLNRCESGQQRLHQSVAEWGIDVAILSDPYRIPVDNGNRVADESKAVAILTTGRYPVQEVVKTQVEGVAIAKQIFYIDSINERLEVLNKELSFCEVFLDSPVQSRKLYGKVILKVQFTYTKVWKCFAKINEIFGWSSILLVLKQFVYLTVTSFWCINKPKIMEINIREQSEAVLEIVLVISALYMLCHSAAACKKEASKLIQLLLKPIELTFEEWDVRDFLALLHHQPFTSTANKFFDIDYSLLGSTLAATVTYIVIMLQLEQN
ncbi:putative gustatory receptor 2a [Malaya genurostris]|uniref:putative gustatory receptor 2a n=1 Tax=Malaya genurostris TaxID=325434 RepID=UPI0026F402A4|nr:putative gustatory receptor 2a [Malaya genurostris]